MLLNEPELAPADVARGPVAHFLAPRRGAHVPEQLGPQHDPGRDVADRPQAADHAQRHQVGLGDHEVDGLACREAVGARGHDHHRRVARADEADACDAVGARSRFGGRAVAGHERPGRRDEEDGLLDRQEAGIDARGDGRDRGAVRRHVERCKLEPDQVAGRCLLEDHVDGRHGPRDPGDVPDLRGRYGVAGLGPGAQRRHGASVGVGGDDDRT